jgi:hypothetical protein
MFASLGHEVIEDAVEFQVTLLAGVVDAVGQGIALSQEVAVLTVEDRIADAVAWIPLHSIRHCADPVLDSPYSKTQ